MACLRQCKSAHGASSTARAWRSRIISDVHREATVAGAASSLLEPTLHSLSSLLPLVGTPVVPLLGRAW